MALLPLRSCSRWECWAHSGCCQVVIARCYQNRDSGIHGRVPSSPSHFGCSMFPVASALSCPCRMLHVVSSDTHLFAKIYFAFGTNYAEDCSPSAVKLILQKLPLPLASCGSLQTHKCCCSPGSGGAAMGLGLSLLRPRGWRGPLLSNPCFALLSQCD